jgi:hypothetical protein
MAQKENAVVATAPAKQEDIRKEVLLTVIDSQVETKINGKKYKKCTVTLDSGVSARGIIDEANWGKCTVGETVTASVRNVDGKPVFSVLGAPLPAITFADWGITPDFKVG